MHSVNGRSQTSYHTTHNNVGYGKPGYRRSDISGQRHALLPEIDQNRITASSSWVDQYGHDEWKDNHKSKVQTPSNGYLVLGSQMNNERQHGIKRPVHGGRDKLHV